MLSRATSIRRCRLAKALSGSDRNRKTMPFVESLSRERKAQQFEHLALKVVRGIGGGTDVMEKFLRAAVIHLPAQ